MRGTHKEVITSKQQATWKIKAVCKVPLRNARSRHVPSRDEPRSQGGSGTPHSTSYNTPNRRRSQPFPFKTLMMVTLLLRLLYALVWMAGFRSNASRVPRPSRDLHLPLLVSDVFQIRSRDLHLPLPDPVSASVQTRSRVWTIYVN